MGDKRCLRHDPLTTVETSTEFGKSSDRHECKTLMSGHCAGRGGAGLGLVSAPKMIPLYYVWNSSVWRDHQGILMFSCPLHRVNQAPLQERAAAVWPWGILYGPSKKETFLGAQCNTYYAKQTATAKSAHRPNYRPTKCGKMQKPAE